MNNDLKGSHLGATICFIFMRSVSLLLFKYIFLTVNKDNHKGTYFPQEKAK